MCLFVYTVNSVIPALLAGNPVLLKQSPQTPKCADLFVEVLREAGVPADAIQAIHVDDAGADHLVRHPGIQYVSFTGSVAVGKKIRKAIGDSERLIGLGMELGGKDPAYVLPDANINYAVENIVDGAFFNSGQCCCSIERCYVHVDVYDEFIEKAVALTQVIVGIVDHVNEDAETTQSNLLVRNTCWATLMIRRQLSALWPICDLPIKCARSLRMPVSLKLHSGTASCKYQSYTRTRSSQRRKALDRYC